ncbi:MAG: hypothetical protein RL757_2000 [Bacteroidota bacterium]|jgi:uncharacterized protein (DUF2141 family)
MKNTFKKRFVFCFSLFLVAFFSVNSTWKYAENCLLKVTVHNIKASQGRIRVAIYNSSATFLDSKKYFSIQAAPTNGQSSVTLGFSLPYGDYAFTAYHDLNDNKNLDRSSLGVPEEPYSLSNGVNVKWRKPTFSECKVRVSQTNQDADLHLRLWSDR